MNPGAAGSLHVVPELPQQHDERLRGDAPQVAGGVFALRAAPSSGMRTA